LFILNGLLAELLIQLGYTVCRVPSYVYVENKMFRDVVSHIILIVSCPDKPPESLWMVDVGFGEPSIHPLRYDRDAFSQIQSSPDGMLSKICKMDDGTDDVLLYWWYSPFMAWVPRLKWNYSSSMLKKNGPSLASFASALSTVKEEASIFTQKMICCRLTREQKFTVAGNKYKVTGPPRFINGDTLNMVDSDNGNNEATPSSSQVVPIVVHQIESEDELRTILRDNFAIPIEATDGISLVTSIAADPNIWSNQ
jgi:arylamine N-acetyltransferase